MTAFSYSRIVKSLLFFLMIGMILVARLFYLQFFESSRLALNGLYGRIQEVSVEVGRGGILDRNGLALTNTTQYFAIVVFPSQVANVSAVAAKLAGENCGKASAIAAQIKTGMRPFKIRTGVDAATAERINRERIPGVVAIAEKVRYDHNSVATHVVGYVNTADNKGVSGIEQTYENVLHGEQPLFLAALVDAGQQLIPGLGYKLLRLDGGMGLGKVMLTIDSRVQRVVERVMDQHMSKGAVVVLQPRTGEILAMASRPNFDANNVGAYLDQHSAPLMNRAISQYQPGSVFKLVVAAAALEEKIVRPDDIFYDKGYIDIDNLRFQGWDHDKGARGRISFSEALAYSSNPVFIEVGQKLGARRLLDYAKRLGFGQKTGLALSPESAGNLPMENSIYPGDLANLSIGQGLLEASPLQIACLVSTIVNDGIKVEPHIVERVTTSSGARAASNEQYRGMRVLSSGTAAAMRKMMTATTTIGTGREAYVDNGGSAGKTGTAETGRMGADGKGISHAWFAGYAPLDNPQVVVVVFVEDGMSGGDVAAPIFRDIVSQIYPLNNIE